MDDEYFRASAGILVIDGGGRVLALERDDLDGAWQLPQGGITTGEDPLAAAARELEEETGLAWSSVELLEELPTWLTYELPEEARSEKTGRGQVQKWFLVRLTGTDADIDLRSGAAAPEFKRAEWMTIADLMARTWIVRRPIYCQLALSWSAYLA